MSGKAPVLQVFASELNASEFLIGAIVSVSILTGLFLKPIIGFLSDRTNQWIWLVVGTALFSFTPFLYIGVDAPEELVGLRLVHGLATAIYGPVTLAYVAGLGTRHTAEWFGWFGTARTASSVLGPLVGGALLGLMTPTQVYSVTGLVALLAFVPVFYLSHEVKQRSEPDRFLSKTVVLASLRQLMGNRAIALFGITEMISRIGVYAVKTFLPLMVLHNGGTPLDAGVFLAIQEAAAAIVRPLAGRISDNTGSPRSIACAGLTCMSFTLVLLPPAVHSNWLVVVAVLIGIGQGTYAPAALAMIAQSTGPQSRGVSFGVVGALRNSGKLLGPVLAGVLLMAFSFQQAFLILGAMPLLAIAVLMSKQNPKPRYRVQTADVHTSVTAGETLRDSHPMVRRSTIQASAEATTGRCREMRLAPRR